MVLPPSTKCSGTENMDCLISRNVAHDLAEQERAEQEREFHFESLSGGDIIYARQLETQPFDDDNNDEIMDRLREFSRNVAHDLAEQE
jgi:hypothetical protein